MLNQNSNAEVASDDVTRFALCVEYAGAAYNGWQHQKLGNVRCIQTEVERALSKVANHPVAVVCAGRTDTGVNGTYQIIHFDCQTIRPIRALVMGTNSHLPDDISIKWAKEVPADFHARFSAKERRYRYVIYSALIKPALLSRGVTWTHKALDSQRMHEAGQHLVGEHDFTSYRAVACQANSPIREIRELNVYQSGNLVVIDVRANAFLQHMIRNIAGVLMAIGSGEADVSWSKEVLEYQDRRQGGVTAPPWGLYFVDVKYPDQYELPASDIGPYFLTQ